MKDKDNIMKKKVFKIISIIILIVLIITLLIWIGYEKYLDENYSAIATVVSIRIGTVLTLEIDDENQFLDKGTYDIALTALKSVKDRNGNEFDRYTLKQGDKIKITASPKKLHLTQDAYDDKVINLDGITKLELLN